jgi:DNA-binding response OmpR family regulator
MELALAEEGYAVHTADSAEAGVRLMEATSYDLVLTDYVLPGHTGAWLLREASRRDLLQGAITLLVTAEAQPGGVPAGQEIVAKPVDFGRFLPQIRTMLSKKGHVVRASDADAPRIELVLYVSRASLPSRLAERELRDVLSHYDVERLTLRIVDVSTQPSDAQRDRIIFTPTLVKRSPSPPLWIVGDLTRANVVPDLLHLCGLDPVATTRH